MDIIIIGAGRVGYTLAKTLSFKHNITIIDKNRDKLNRLEESMDILTIFGNIEDTEIYSSFYKKSFDLFIAVTDSDESNLISTLIVDDILDIKKKIIRLKNDFFANSSILNRLGVDEAIFPFNSTAKKVEGLFDYPKANNVKSFIQSSFKLISIKAHLQSSISFRVSDFINSRVMVVGIEREKRFFTPDSLEYIKEGDLLYLFGDGDIIKKISLKLDKKLPSEIKNIVIFGANLLAQKIALLLLDKGLEIKLIEKDIDYCKEASEILQNRATIINATFEDHHLFEEEGLKNADMMIAVGYNDEENIVKCIESKQHGIQKVVAINNDKAYYDLMHKLGIVVVRGVKTDAYYSILEKTASNSIITQRHFCGGRAVLFMRKIYPNSKLIGSRIRLIDTKGVISFVIRDNLILSKERIEEYKESDITVAFSHVNSEEKIQQWIYTL